jgi:hypothetical protein
MVAPDATSGSTILPRAILLTVTRNSFACSRSKGVHAHGARARLRRLAAMASVSKEHSSCPLCHALGARPGRGACCPHASLEQRSGRRPGPPAQADQTLHVRPSQLRPIVPPRLATGVSHRRRCALHPLSDLFTKCADEGAHLPESLMQQVIGDANSVGNDGKRRIDGTGGNETGRIHYIKVI